MSKKDLFPKTKTEESSQYATMYYNNANNKISHIPRNIDKYKLDLKTDGRRRFEDGKLKISILDGGKPPTASAHRTLDFIMLELAKVNDLPQGKDRETYIPANKLNIDFDNIAKAFGKTEKKARQRLRPQLKRDLDRIYNMEVEWEGNNPKDILKGRIIQEYEPFEHDKRTIYVQLTERFAKYSLRYIMQISRKLLALDGRYTNAYAIGRRLHEHYTAVQMRKTGTYDRLSVKTLLKAAPDILSVEEVRDKHKREYFKIIIKPLIEGLDKLVSEGIIYEWTFWKARNKPLTDEELAQYDFRTLLRCYVHWRMPEPEGLPEKAQVLDIETP